MVVILQCKKRLASYFRVGVLAQVQEACIKNRKRLMRKHFEQVCNDSHVVRVPEMLQDKLQLAIVCLYAPSPV